jgi:hypothetical protein
MSAKDVKRLFTIDLDTYEKAMADLNLYHEMLLQAHSEASKMEVDPEFIEDLQMQAEIIQETLIKFRLSIVNGANFNPGGDTKIH